MGGGSPPFLMLQSCSFCHEWHDVFAVQPSCFWSFQPGCGTFQRHLFAECTAQHSWIPRGSSCFTQADSLSPPSGGCTAYSVCQVFLLFVVFCFVFGFILFLKFLITHSLSFFWFSGKRCACAWKTDTSSEIFHCCRLDFCRRKTMLS